MKKLLLSVSFLVLLVSSGFAQTDQFWSVNSSNPASLTKEKSVNRLTFPKTFKLFSLNLANLRQELMKTVSPTPLVHSIIISVPNADGQLEQFEMMEASNFEPALQAKFPEIRAFSGKGITDRYATVKLSISPQGIETMVFRTEKDNEFMEPYTSDHTVYAVYKSHREIGKLPWTCTTQDQQIASGLSDKINGINTPTSSAGELRTMRLAQSVTAEYSNYFLAFNASQVGLVLTAVNNTLTRCNGCYEKDLAIHLNLIANTTDVFYYDPNTDPYSPAGIGAGGAWNGELQSTLTSVIGEANYDIGHLFGATGGGGNAGCIGCVCVNGQKGSGFTSPADGIPMGDNFDIDYVVHEVGHQLGANHTFSFSLEGTGVNKEVGAGITIMGYAGITSYDPAPHSIDIYHQASIAQIQANMAIKTCPVTTNITANNATPVVAPVSNYTIPKSTPFALTGSATDANNDPLTYCWEQNDNSTTSGANSVASPTKLTGPNWLSFPATVSPTRLCPKLSTILAGLFITPPFSGGDAICNIEALSSVARTLKFRLTVRDNHPYSSTVPLAIGQTAFTDMTVTVDATTGPFGVTAPNTAVTWNELATQTVTWSVNGTTGAPVNCSDVKISLSIDGGNTFPFVLAVSTPNDGSETVTIPAGTQTTTARIKVESIGNIFFDIDDANFTIAAPLPGFGFSTAVINGTIACGVANSSTVTLGTTSNAGYITPITLSATGNPPGTTVSFSPNPVVPGSSTDVTLNNTSAVPAGTYTITVTGISGIFTQTKNITFTVSPGTGPVINNQPAAQAACVGTPASFSVTSATALSYQWQLSTDGGATWANITGATSTSYTNASVLATQNNYQYRCQVTGQCNTTTSNAAVLTVNTAPAITTQPQDIAICAGSPVTFTTAASGAGVTYQWQISTDGGTTWNNIGGATAASYNFTTALSQNGYQYRCVATGTCSPSTTSAAATLTVSTSIVISTQPTSSAVCVNGTTSFSTAAAGTVTYQWQESTDGGATWSNITNGGMYSGATTTTLTLTGVPVSAQNNQYRCVVSGTCPSVNSQPAVLSVNTPPAISSQPVSSTIICASQGTSFSVSANGTSLNYQWQISTNGGTTWTNLLNAGAYSGVNTATLTISGATVGMNGYLYQCIVSGTCSPSATTTISTLTVYTPVSISANPGNSIVCENSNASFSVLASGTSPAYQWQVSTNGGASFTNVANGGVYSGATLPVLSLSGVGYNLNNAVYRCVVTGASPCGPVNSGGGVLTVNAAPTDFSLTGGGAYCAGSNGVPIGLSSSTIGINYQLLLNGVNTGTPIHGNGNPTSFGNITVPGVYTVTAYNTVTGCIKPLTGSVTVVVNPLPALTFSASPYTKIYPGLLTILTANASSAATPINYAWFKNNIAFANNASTYTVGIAGLGNYKVAVTDANGCSVQSQVITITDSANAKLFVYPNPNTGQFTVTYYNPGGFTAKQIITIFSAKGEKVYTNVFTTTQAYQLFNVDLRKNGAGIYYVILSDANGNRIKTSQVLIQ
ncbi:MAG: zinc-dependent metalloprotease [Bacteroidetes bacterium]|nr:zinc-dependent metalloprotease [Bacteroidota bacterium]